MITRDALTKIFLQQWGKSTDDVNMKLFSRKWWQSTRVNKQTAFRLSEEGYEFLIKELDLKEYEIPFTEPIELSPQTIVFLERYIDCPYYLTTQSITVFSERKSFELYLFSDDIRKFGLVKAMNEREKDLAKLDKDE
ncbi:MAG: hypothetical protein ORN50_04640 [Crocinitomicaceae bacterium]|jgi:hypothetical protein|nr:hypothetical protein [Crocinitomicaceae bacterium]